jgi:hypothetical protein
MRIHIRLPVYNKHFIILEQQVAVVVVKMVGVAVLGSILMGKMSKIEPSQLLYCNMI